MNEHVWCFSYRADFKIHFLIFSNVSCLVGAQLKQINQQPLLVFFEYRRQLKCLFSTDMNNKRPFETFSTIQDKQFCWQHKFNTNAFFSNFIHYEHCRTLLGATNINSCHKQTNWQIVLKLCVVIRYRAVNLHIQNFSDTFIIGYSNDKFQMHFFTE